MASLFEMPQGFESGADYAARVGTFSPYDVAEIGASILPGIGEGISARDLAESYAQGDKLGMLLASLGLMPGIGAGARGIKGIRKAAAKAVPDAERLAFPGIYKRPDEIAADAAARTVPESPALKQLWGVTRDDLKEISKRSGNMDAPIDFGVKPRGSAAAEKIMNPYNTQRITDTLAEAGKYPELATGMDAWYVMDPMYQRLESLVGPAAAKTAYTRMNTFSGMASPASDVLKEVNRGTAARYLADKGRFSDFMEYGGKLGTPGTPDDIAGDIVGHLAHKTSHGLPMQQYVDAGVPQVKAPKVPSYYAASGVPETGFQTATPVGDAHWVRGISLADARTAPKGFAESVKKPELFSLTPWWQGISSDLGLEAVPAQARAWGAFAPQTGVKTPVGAPKLELISDQIMNTAQKLGQSPETVRDAVLLGENFIRTWNMPKGSLF